ncbi:hypothetical protein SCHPADRAFT_73990 [Schizopora paradoxa]|uniref:Uncharacterized protein n=1 Tax=Schizopora paradoxa TaxID=27342 RepID=A0A0H2S5X5_9AGAM|nr:hypothetical protein SCHPADRAFT_73990 [Schizopora paradoxa]
MHVMDDLDEMGDDEHDLDGDSPMGGMQQIATAGGGGAGFATTTTDPQASFYPGPMTAPLRAVHAPPAMRRLMSVIRLDPYISMTGTSGGESSFLLEYLISDFSDFI